MVDEVVGRGIIEVVGDSTQLVGAMAQAEQAVEKFENAAVDSAKNAGAAFTQTAAPVTAATDKIDAATKRYINSVEREIATTSLSRAEFRRWEAQVKGIPESVYGPLNKRLEEARKAQEAATAALRTSGTTVQQAGKVYNQYGQTVKQTNAALRQVPAQITDIVVSLQGGTAPLTVLLQQGGQLKDQFGGIVPAFKALTATAIGMINPFTILAAAVGVLAFGYAKGSREADVFRKNILLTGNAVGTTVGDLNVYAAAIDNVIGTQSQAAETLAQFVASGRVARENLQQFATVAIQVQKTVGTATEETVKQFAELGKEPVEASKRLNEQTNFLTFAVYEQIKALQEQGRETEAANLAQRTYAETLAQRTGQITANLGLIERGWNAIKSATFEAGDAILSVGRRQAAAQRVLSLQEELQGLSAPRGLVGSALQRPRGLIEQELRDAQREAIDARVRASNRALDARANKQAIEAEGVISRIRRDSATNTQKLNKELTDYRRNLERIRQVSPNNPLLDPAAIARDEAAIRERFKERGGSGRTRAVTDDAATRRLQQLRETEASLRLELSTTEKLVGAQRDLAEFNQLIADLKEKRVLTADQKSLVAAQNQIRAQLDANVALQQRLRLRDEETKKIKEQEESVRKLEDRAAQIQASIAEATRARSEQYDARLAVFGRGSEAREQLASETAVRREFQRFQDQLRKSTPKDLLGSDLYRQEQAKIEESLNVALQANRNYYEQLRVLQSDWQNGAQESLQNYVDNVANLSTKLEDLFTKAFKGAEDALVQFVRTGKLDFKSLADSIVTDLVRIAVQQQVTGPLAQLIGSGISSGTGAGGFVGTALSALFGSRAIGGPVSGPRAYEVAENGPELLNWQGRQYVIPGNGMGQVEPMSKGSSERPMQVTNQFYLTGPVDRRTQSQIAAEAGRGVQRALARNS